MIGEHRASKAHDERERIESVGFHRAALLSTWLMRTAPIETVAWIRTTLWVVLRGGSETIDRLSEPTECFRQPAASVKEGVDTRFLALSVSDAADDVIAVIRAGARGYVTKTIAPADLSQAIKRVHDGDAVFSPRLAGFVLDAFAGALPLGEIDPELDQLTPRERAVLRFIARGYAYKEAGRELHISVRTVETHVSSVLRKLQLSSRYELTRWASDRRLV